MTFLRRHSLAVLAVLLGACSTPPPAVVTMMGTKAHGDATTIAARTGDSVYTLAQYLNVDLRALIDQNNLTPPYDLRPGQVLKIPAPAIITANRRDNIFSIAQAYKVDQTELVRLNDLRYPFELHEGQVLKLPTPAAPEPVMMAEAQPADDPNNDPAYVPVDNTPISPVKPVIAAEDLAPPPGSVEAPKDSKLAALTPPASPATPSAPAALPANSPFGKASPPPAKPAAKEKPSLGTGVPKFSWPSNGSTLSDFGPKAAGRHNDGINIGAPLGSPVRAAAAGEVVYTGDNVAGFGNLILLRHSGGYASAYAHLQNPLVSRGDMVTAGQSIAQVGKTGNVSTPQLHFEIRKGTKPVNPKTYLP